MCMIEDADGPPEFLKENIKKARKVHRCCECGREISMGEKYRYSVGKWNGEIEFYRTCYHCMQAHEFLIAQCGGFVFTCVAEDLREHIDLPSGLGMIAARMFVGMRRKWKSFRKNDLMPAPNFKISA